MKYTIVKINSVDVTAYLQNPGWKIDQRISSDASIDELIINFKPTITEVPVYDKIVEVYSGYTDPPTTRKFYGLIRTVETKRIGYKVHVYSNLIKAVDALVNTVYTQGGSTGGVVTAIAKDLFETHAGMTASVVTSGDKLEKFICKNTDVLERTSALADAIGYDIDYDHDADIVYFRPTEYIVNPNTIYIGGANSNVSTTPKWKDDGMDDVFSKVTIFGAKTLVSDTKNYNGDAATKNFSVDFPPETVKITVDGVEKIGGIEGSSISYDYTVDKEAKEIQFVIAPGAALAIVIEYFYNVPIPVIVGDGTPHRLFTFNDIATVEDAIQRGNALLENANTVFRTTTVKLKPSQIGTLDMKIGQKVKVTDVISSIDGFFVIKKLVEKYPNYMELLIGDKEWKENKIELSTQMRLKRLEEQANEGEPVVTQVIQKKTGVKVKRKQLQVVGALINDSFILGHSENDKLGMGQILDDFE